jgi:3-hydroxyacyl-[acyl-carrier-protein] dehydratase
MLSYEEIKKYLPQRFPMIMVDQVIEYEAGKRLKAIKNVTANEIYFLGHFPQKAIMPGAFILEGLAQCMLVLFQLTYGPIEPEAMPLFGSVQARFLRPIYPGDRMVCEVEAIKMISTAGIFKGQVKVDEVLTTSCEMSFGKRYDD